MPKATKLSFEAARPKNPIGRPPDSSYLAEFCLKRWYEYENAVNVSKGAVGRFFNSTATSWIAEVGWEDPLHAKRNDGQQASKEKVAEVAAQVTIAQAMAAMGSGEGAADETQVKRDQIVTAVRKKISSIFQAQGRFRKKQDPRTESKKASAEMAQLFKSLTRQPKRMTAHAVWMSGNRSPEFESAVDERLALKVIEARRKGVPPPPRAGVENQVASERYAELDEEEKQKVEQQVEAIHAEDMKMWLARTSAEPESPEDAREFLQNAVPFLNDLAQFIATRGSAMVVWYTAGPNGDVYSAQATTDMPGQTNYLWKDLNAEAHKQLSGNIGTQAAVINKTKWSGLLQTPELSVPPTILDEHHAERNDSFPPPPPPDSSEPDPAAATLSPTAAPTERTHPPPSAPHDPIPSLVTVTGDRANAAAGAPLPPTHRTAVVAPSKGNKVDELDVSALEHIPPAANEARTGAGYVDDPPAKPSAPSIAPNTQSDDVCTPAIQSKKTSAAALSAPAPNASGDVPVMSSIFAFESGEAKRDWSLVEATYENEFGRLAIALAGSKPWFSDDTKSEVFFRDVKKKMAGQVHVGLACAVALEYMKLECSSVEEGTLPVQKIDGQLLPAYLADFSKRKWAARWHSRAAGDKRTMSTLDAAVAETLPIQWALLQPAARRSEDGRVVAEADASLTWEGLLPSGSRGVRTFVVTLLIWGSAIKSDELAIWIRLAVDVVEVMKLVTSQAPKAKISDDHAGAGEGIGKGQRIKIPSQKKRAT